MFGILLNQLIQFIRHSIICFETIERVNFTNVSSRSNIKQYKLYIFFYLKMSLNPPSFLNADDFAKQNQKVVKYIGFCAEQIKKPPEKNYLNYCLFNEFNS